MGKPKNNELTGEEMELRRREAEYHNFFTTAETLGVDLLGLVIDEFKALPNVWQKLPQYDQDEVIERVRQRVQAATLRAVTLIQSVGHYKVIATNDGVAIKDDIKATLVVARDNEPEALQELFASHKKTVMIVLVDDERFVSGMDDVRGDPDQRRMFDDQSAEPKLKPKKSAKDDGNSAKAGAKQTETGDPDYQKAVDLVVEHQKVTVPFVQRHLNVTYNRAEELIGRMEIEKIVSKKNNSGQREVLRTA